MFFQGGRKKKVENNRGENVGDLKMTSGNQKIGEGRCK